MYFRFIHVDHRSETVEKKSIVHMIPSSGSPAELVPGFSVLPRSLAEVRSPASPTGGRLPRPRPTQCASPGQTPISSHPKIGKRRSKVTNISLRGVKLKKLKGVFFR